MRNKSAKNKVGERCGWGVGERRGGWAEETLRSASGAGTGKRRRRRRRRREVEVEEWRGGDGWPDGMGVSGGLGRFLGEWGWWGVVTAVRPPLIGSPDPTGSVGTHARFRHGGW